MMKLKLLAMFLGAYVMMVALVLLGYYLLQGLNVLWELPK